MSAKNLWYFCGICSSYFDIQSCQFEQFPWSLAPEMALHFLCAAKPHSTSPEKHIYVHHIRCCFADFQYRAGMENSRPFWNRAFIENYFTV